MNTEQNATPWNLLRPRRKIWGISAILLPYTSAGTIDWNGFDHHLQRTADAGLTPAVNMDTGFGPLLKNEERQAILKRTRSLLGNETFVAGAIVSDRPGDPCQTDPYKRAIDDIQSHAGIPVLFPSYGLNRQSPDAIVASHQDIARAADRFIAFELGDMFAPVGKIHDLATYQAIMQIPNCIGSKHSSLSRSLEWDRLALRDRLRPDFHVFTGNDLAIDMVMFGSDYLLGLSSFAPDLFARRDRYWQQGSPDFFPLNDLLQYLGAFAFRPPVPAYKHTAAQFLKLRGWIDSNQTHPRSPTRPDSDIPILAEIVRQLPGDAP